MDIKPQRKPLHLKTFDYTNSSSIYFITVCTADKEPHFRSAECAGIILEELRYRKAVKEINLFCYCLMPDHLHVLLSIGEGYGKGLQHWVATFKRHTSKAVKEACGIKPLWHKNFFEHIVRKEESLLAIAEYILNNPVRKGLAEKWSDFPYCKMEDDLPL